MKTQEQPTVSLERLGLCEVTPLFPYELNGHPELVNHIPQMPVVPHIDGEGYTIALGELLDEKVTATKSGLKIYQSRLTHGVYGIEVVPNLRCELPRSFGHGYPKAPIIGFVLYAENLKMPTRLSIFTEQREERYYAADTRQVAVLLGQAVGSTRRKLEAFNASPYSWLNLIT